MCGITIYKGDSTQILTIWNAMLQIKHRGDEDGFGYINLTNNEVIKSILTFDEIEKGKIDDKRKLKPITLTKLKGRITEITSGFHKKTNLLAIHNRKASCGDVSLTNTHPIKISKHVYYIHNGGVEGSDSLKRYLNIKNEAKFTTETDSELLAYIIENELKIGQTSRQIFDTIGALYPYGFGVIARIDLRTKEIIIFKDIDRSLYLYKKNNNYLLLSEPIITFKKFDICYMLNEGVITINNTIDIDKCKVVDITDNLHEVLAKEGRTYSCDRCKSKGRTINLYDNKDFCLVCATCGVDLQKEAEEEKKKEDKKDHKPLTKYGNQIYNNAEWCY